MAKNNLESIKTMRATIAEQSVEIGRLRALLASIKMEREDYANLNHSMARELAFQASKLPVYRDTGESFVPGYDPCWVVDGCGRVENAKGSFRPFIHKGGRWVYDDETYDIEDFFSSEHDAKKWKSDNSARYF